MLLKKEMEVSSRDGDRKMMLETTDGESTPSEARSQPRSEDNPMIKLLTRLE